MKSLLQAARGRHFGVIYVDPPWRFQTWSDKGRGRSPKYRTMTLDEMAVLPVDEIAAENCVLVMWHVSTHLAQAVGLASVWGFTGFLPDGFVWIKTVADGSRPRMGLGYHTRRSAELCAFAFKGRPRRQDKGVPQVLMAPRGEHSAKPAGFRERLERLYPGPYIELFARERTVGWTSWGDEI